MFRFVFHIVMIFVLAINSLPVLAIEGVPLPLPGSMVNISPGFKPARLVGIQIDSNNPFRFNFFMDLGDELLSGEALRAESERLVKYFLAAMTVPEEDQWVNLSPYEDKRIVSENFARTEMGRDLLAQDYMLKQIMASLVYPEAPLGKKFWAEVYRRAQESFGTTDIPYDVFNKVWISPDKTAFYENGNIAMLANASMKVALERDYLAEKALTPGDQQDEAEED